jgi:hypothetical protein
METELRQAYCTLRDDISNLRKFDRESLLNFSASVEVVIELISYYKSNDILYFKDWVNKVNDLIYPEIAKLNKREIFQSRTVKLKDILKGVEDTFDVPIPDKNVQLPVISPADEYLYLSLKRGNISETGKLRFIYYVLSTLMDCINKCKVEEKTNNKKGNVKPPIETVDPMSLIRPFWRNQVIDFETTLKDKILKWKDHGGLVECAAFCDYLYRENFFLVGSKKLRVKVCSQFALNKYDLDIRTQLKKTSTERIPKIEEIANLLKQG